MTQSPWCARITSGWIASSPWSPLDTCWDFSSARTAAMLLVSTYMNPFGSCTPKRFSGMSTLIAETLNVSCGALAQGLVAAVVVTGVDAAGGTAAIAVAPGLTK